MARPLVEQKALAIGGEPPPENQGRQLVHKETTVVPFEELAMFAAHLNDEGDFPTWLMTDIMQIAGNPELYADKADEVGKLIEHMKNFDPYAGVGCFESSVSAETIEATIRHILISRGS
jgi:hypothetical protein